MHAVTTLMKKIAPTRADLLLLSTYFAAWCAFAVRPTPWTQLGSMAMTLIALFYILTLLIHAALKWRERWLRNVAMSLLIIVTLPIAVLTGKGIRGAIFSYQYDRWNQAVSWVITHPKPTETNPLIELPPEYADLASGVNYRSDDVCGVTIDFFWGGAFPLRHTVRRYATNPEWVHVKECYQGWRRGRKIAENWYEISD